MCNWLQVIFLVCAGAYASGSVALELGVLAPVLKNGTALEKADQQGRRAPVVTRLRSGELHDQLQKEATEGFTSLVLALDVAAQRAAGATVPEPTWLYLSTEDGGFARRGFWLNEGKKQRYVSDPFVDLVVDAGSVRDGSFEEIFAHEMGHVFLRRLLPTLPHGYSRTPHSSFSITDDPTAFDEGFAIHFQGLARRLTRNPSLRDQDLGLEYKPLVPYWLSNLDRATRVDGMRRNWFVQAQITLPGTGEALARRDQSTLFDTARLKNGNQMLASEGVIATLFYRWLVPGSPERAPILERYSRLFAALAVMKGQELAPDSPVFLAAVERFCQMFPEEAARVLTLVVDTTYGATADTSLIAPIEELATRGRFGDMKGFVSELHASRASLVQVRAAVLQSPNRLRAALGPALWLWSGRRAVNLNTAELEELLELPGVDRASAERALGSRRREGTFRDLADFGSRAGLSAASVARFKQMAEAMQREGTYLRR